MPYAGWTLGVWHFILLNADAIGNVLRCHVRQNYLIARLKTFFYFK